MTDITVNLVGPDTRLALAAAKRAEAAADAAPIDAEAAIAPLLADAETAAALAGRYANANTDADIPGAPAGDRGGRYWAGRASYSEAQAQGYAASAAETVASTRRIAVTGLNESGARTDAVAGLAGAGLQLARSTAAALTKVDTRLTAIEQGGAGWITGARVSAYGWNIEIDVPAAQAGGALDVSKIFVTSYDWGYDVIDGEITKVIRTRVMQPTAAVRKPSPDQASRQESVVGGTATLVLALPQFIFDKAKNGGAGTTGLDPVISTTAGWYTAGGVAAKGQVFKMTNNSAETYPKPCAHFQTPPFRRLTDAGGYTFEIMGAGLGAREKRTLAAVECILSGQTSGLKLRKVVNAITVSDYSTAGSLPAIVYAAKPTVTEMARFAPFEQVNERWRAYPWIGDESAILDSDAGAGIKTAEFSTRSHLFDPAASYPTYYACVDSAAGVNATGVASSDPAAARAAPFLNDSWALWRAHQAGIAGAGAGKYLVVLEFKTGDHSLRLAATRAGTPPSFEPSYEDIPQALPASWTVYRKEPSAGVVRFTSNSSSRVPDLCRVEGITLHASVNATASVTQGNTGSARADKHLWLLNTPFTNEAGLATLIQVYNCGQVYGIGITSAGADVSNCLFMTYANTTQDWMLVRNCDVNRPGTTRGLTYNGVKFATGNSASFSSYQGAAFYQLDTDGAVWANCAIYKNLTSAVSLTMPTVRGAAAVNCLFEVAENGAQPAVRLWSDGINAPAKNIYFYGVGGFGERWNVGYEDSFTMTDSGDGKQQLKKIFCMVGCIMQRFNHKDDTFQSVPARIHTWNVGYHVEMAKNAYLGGSNDGAVVPGPTAWLGEVLGTGDVVLNAVSPSTLFANFLAGPGGGGGGGDYRPKNGAQAYLPTWSASELPVPFAMDGTLRLTDGTAVIGPLERQTA